jgi:hypothetical protein
MRTLLRKRLVGLFWKSFFLALPLCGLSLSHGSGTGDSEATSPETTKVVNVIVINIDPILKSRGGLKLHELMKWSDPWQLTDRMVSDARTASHGFVNYRVAEKID